jgi:effector-binding domain-containing protein
MSLAGKILYAAGAVALLVVIVGLALPSTAHVSRETTIDAPAATVFALASDVRRMQEWSPWVDLPQNFSPTFRGPGRGPGASVHWKSPQTGSSRLTVVESAPFRSVVMEIERDGSAPYRSVLTLDGSDARTLVMWTFDSHAGLDLLERYLRPVLARRVGRIYEQGLLNLKSMAESLPRADFSDLEIEHMIIDAAPIAYVTASSMPSTTAVSEAMGAAFFDVLRFLDRHGLKEAGAPISISRSFSGSRLVFDAAIPVTGITNTTPQSSDGVSLGTSYGGPVIRVTHVGSYGELATTHEKIAAYLAAYGMQQNGQAWESYESDPARTPEAELRTYVWYPVTEAPGTSAPPTGLSPTSPGTGEQPAVRPPAAALFSGRCRCAVRLPPAAGPSVVHTGRRRSPTSCERLPGLRLLRSGAKPSAASRGGPHTAGERRLAGRRTQSPEDYPRMPG